MPINFLVLPWIIAHGPRPKMANYDPYKILDFNTLSERSLSKLSENPKIFDIGPTVLKLGQMKEFVNFGPIPW